MPLAKIALNVSPICIPYRYAVFGWLKLHGIQGGAMAGCKEEAAYTCHGELPQEFDIPLRAWKVIQTAHRGGRGYLLPGSLLRPLSPPPVRSTTRQSIGFFNLFDHNFCHIVRGKLGNKIVCPHLVGLFFVVSVAQRAVDRHVNMSKPGFSLTFRVKVNPSITGISISVKTKV